MSDIMRRAISPLLAVVLLCGALYVAWQDGGVKCNKQIRTQPMSVVVTAFAPEREAVHAHMMMVGTCEFKGISYTLGTIAGTPVLVFESGMGPGVAEEHVQQTLEHFSIALLVFSGIAGGTRDTLTVGDTLVAREWFDMEHDESVFLDESLVELAMQVSGVEVVGTGVTVDSFVEDVSVLPERAYLVDMETARVAATAQAYAVPFMAFRSISDFADGSLSDEEIARAATASAQATTAFIALFVTNESR